MFGFLARFCVFALVVHNLNMATSNSASDIKQIIRDGVVEAKKKRTLRRLAAIAICFLSNGLAWVIAVAFRNGFEAVCNGITLYRDASAKVDALRKEEPKTEEDEPADTAK